MCQPFCTEEGDDENTVSPLQATSANSFTFLPRGGGGGDLECPFVLAF